VGQLPLGFDIRVPCGRIAPHDALCNQRGLIAIGVRGHSIPNLKKGDCGSHIKFRNTAKGRILVRFRSQKRTRSSQKHQKGKQ